MHYSLVEVKNMYKAAERLRMKPHHMEGRKGEGKKEGKSERKDAE